MLKAGVDVNVMYKPEIQPKVELLDSYFKNKVGPCDTENPYYTRAIIDQVRQSSNISEVICKNNIQGLLKYGAKLDLTDSDKRDSLMYAVMDNNIKLISQLLETRSELGLNT